MSSDRGSSRTSAGDSRDAPLSVQPDVDLDSISPTVGNRLAVGQRLDEYEISGVLGEGGFGIVYLAWDHSLHRRLAIKEYMPAALSRRGVGTQVEVFDEHSAESFKAGLRSFVNEAKLLASFDHPSLLKVHRFWQGNGTAYMVMPLYEGVTLKQALAARGDLPDEAWLRGLLMPLLDALDYLHARSCYHRDIAPDNIMLLEDGRPLLLDFGAARRLIGDMNKAVTVILKSGYAPIEQYGDTPGLTQGPWTDIYALGAVLHHAITGKVPKASISRMLDDKLPPLAQRCAGRYSDAFLATVDRMLAVQPRDRPQSIAEVRALLDPPGHTARAVPADRAAQSPRSGASADVRRRPLAAGATLALLGLGWGAWSWLSPVPAPVAPDAPSPAPPAAAAGPSPAAATAQVPVADPARAAADAGPPSASEQRSAAPTTVPAPARAVARPVANPTVDAVGAVPVPALPRAVSPSQSATPPRPPAPTSARCAEIVQRVSLGEALSPVDRQTLAEECRR